MKQHQLYDVAMPRGAAKQVDREMGLYTEGRIARTWCREVRPEHGADTTGRYSPFNKATKEILAHDRVNPETADILMFDMYAQVHNQRAERDKAEVETDPRSIAVSLVEAAAAAARAVLGTELPQEHREAVLAIAGGCLMRARLFVERPEPTPTTGRVVELKIAA